MNTNDTRKLTPEQEALLAEMKTAVAAYDGPVTRIPQGKRTTRPPSKKPGESSSRQGHWTERQERLAFGD
jgi:hypothetical protein